jgi:hypothetical protein
MEATICLMNSSLSFSGVVAQNFLNDLFNLILTSIKLVEIQKSLLTPYLVPTLKTESQRDFRKSLKEKSPIFN